MNGEGQRPPAPPESAQAGQEAPEPGNARFPPSGQNGAHGQQQAGQGQPGEGGGRRRFRRQRRGGRGRRGKGGGGQQNQVQPPLDAQGRIVDVENDDLDDGADEGAPTPADGNVAVPPPQPSEQQAAPADGNVSAPAQAPV